LLATHHKRIFMDVILSDKGLLARMLLFLIVFINIPYPGSAQVYTPVDAGFPVCRAPAADWVDADNDGDLDVFLSGLDENAAPAAHLYLNDQGSFSAVSSGITGVSDAACAFFDYNNDGLPDLALTGLGATAASSKVYRNEGAGVFSDAGAALTGLYGGGIGWGDMNSNGYPDLLLSGTDDGGSPKTLLYYNNGSTFTPSGISFEGLAGGSIACADIDLDKDIDFVVNGKDNNMTARTIVYVNENGSFSALNAGITGLEDATASWGDYNNDSYPDLLISGAADDGTARIIVCKNNNGTSFSPITGPFEGIVKGSAIWGDFDNDGALDFLAGGSQFIAGNGGPPVPGTPAKLKIYFNQGNDQFLMQPIVLSGVENNAIRCGDYDADSDIDILLAGDIIQSISSSGENAVIYRNETSNFNDPPSAPDGLSMEAAGNSLLIEWDPAVDDLTPSEGLSYNLRAGTQEGNMDILSALADLNNGFRRIVLRGNTGGNTSWQIDSVGFGTYYASVQAIDHSFAGSGFSTDAVAEITPTATFTVADSSCIMLETTVTYTGNASPAAQYDWDFNGAVIVSGSGQGPYIVYWDTEGLKTISLVVTENGVSSDPFNREVLVESVPGTPGTPSGSTELCQGEASTPFVILPLSNAEYYEWGLYPPEAGSITGNGILAEVLWNTSFFGEAEVFVRAGNYCGISSYSDSLEVAVDPVPGISARPEGPVKLCLNDPNTIYTTSGAAYGLGYLWELLPAAAGVIYGNGLEAEIDWDNTYTGEAAILVRAYNDCGAGPVSDTLHVVINVPPAADAGEDQVITFGSATQLSGSASGGSGNYSYSWFPDSLLSDPQAPDPVTLPLEQSVQFTLYVTDNESGCSDHDQLVVTVTGGPLGVDAIADPRDVCPGDAVSLLALASGGTGNYTYSWTSDPPGFTSSEGETIAYPVVSTTYYVEVSDEGNTVSDSVNVNVRPLPSPAGTISGPKEVCEGDTSVLYEIEAATSADFYLWQLDEGIYGSSDSTSILLSFTEEFIPDEGKISVTPMNACGSGDPSELMVMVLGVPAKPQMLIGPDSVCTTMDSVSSFLLEVPVQDATAYAWKLLPEGAGTIEGSGLEASVLWVKDWEGDASVMVRAENDCGLSEWSNPLLVYAYNTLAIGEPGAADIMLKLFPNPVRGLLYVEYRIENDAMYCITDVYGRKTLGGEFSCNHSRAELELSGLPAGVYVFSLIEDSGIMASRRFVVSK
jgi:hypothetical protein